MTWGGSRVSRAASPSRCPLAPRHLGAAAQGLGHVVVKRAARKRPGFVALRVEGPATIEADHPRQGQFVPYRDVASTASGSPAPAGTGPGDL